VTLVGLKARPELNGREGVVDARKNEERWVVQLCTPDGLRDGKTIALKLTNLQVSAEEPAVAVRMGTCIEISPAPLLAVRDAIPVRIAPEPLPLAMDGGVGGVEAQEIAVLQASRGWQQVRGLKAYTKAGTYPDLYCYFDAADTSSPVNNFAMCAFNAYPMDIGGLPTHGIRGDVVVIRAEPPRSSSFSSVGPGPDHVHHDAWHASLVPLIGVEEIRDTLLFYVSNDAKVVARERDMQRTIQSMPPHTRPADGEPVQFVSPPSW
jgi:hypothetical protein